MPEIAIPVNKIDGLLTPEFEGWLDGIDKRWNKRSPLNGDLSFAFYPLRNNRMLGPKNHDACRGLELTLDDLVVGLTGDDIRSHQTEKPFASSASANFLARIRSSLA